MGILNMIGFLLIALGVWTLFPESPKTILRGAGESMERLAARQKKLPIGKEIRNQKKKKIRKGFAALFYRARQMLVLTGKKTLLSYLSLLAVIMMGIGASIGVFISNYYVVPVLAVLFGSLPYLYVIFLSLRWQRELTAELETTLSIITTSYLRKEDIVKAVAENIEYIHPPMKQIFENFLIQAEYITSSLKSALGELSGKIHHEIWKEWVAALILCQDNKELKVTLTPIVAKLSDGRILTEELAALMYAPVKEYVSIVLLFFLVFPMLAVMMPEWYRPLVETQTGKMAISIAIGMIVASIPGVMGLMKEITYKSES